MVLTGGRWEKPFWDTSDATFKHCPTASADAERSLSTQESILAGRTAKIEEKIKSATFVTFCMVQNVIRSAIQSGVCCTRILLTVLTTL